MYNLNEYNILNTVVIIFFSIDLLKVKMIACYYILKPVYFLYNGGSCKNTIFTARTNLYKCGVFLIPFIIIK